MTPAFTRGTRIAGTGSALPEARLTNADLERLVDTSDEWIRQRTGIVERRKAGPGDTSVTLASSALSKALDAAHMKADELDLIICGTCTGEMNCPATAARISEAVGCKVTGAFDLNAACCGFVYGMNLADTLVRSGRAQRVGVIGVEMLTRMVDYTERGTSIMFGDGAGAAVIVADPDPARGCVFQTMRGDGRMWRKLYRPFTTADVPEGDENNPVRVGYLRMHGREIYKFAVTQFQDSITEALDAAGLKVDDVQQYICHQSNLRIIESAVEKLKLPADRVYVNIERVGNTSSASVGICLDECVRSGKIAPGKPIVLVAFGAGVTWASCVWNV
ncbi:MAG: ketoacyl-ACP synthase III [Phycisphaerae bacterium]|nr:ketoacyl-ACP synthase III [Phycisphaerae bacterium]